MHSMLSRFVIAFLLRIKLLISWLQSPFAVILEPKKIKSVTVSMFSPSIFHEMMEPNTMVLVFLMLSFKSAFSLSSMTNSVLESKDITLPTKVSIVKGMVFLAVMYKCEDCVPKN